MTLGAAEGLFEARVDSGAPYKFRISWPGAEQETEDPYAFGLLLGDVDIYLFNEGRHFGFADVFGAQPMTIDGVSGVRFRCGRPTRNVLPSSAISMRGTRADI